MSDNSEEKYVETTEEDYELFKSECEYWIKFFGLQRWQVYYEHKNLDGYFGRCHTDLNAMCATIMFGNKWPEDCKNSDEIRRTAFHESMELFIAPLDALARARYVNENEIEHHTHVIIRTLENVIFKDHKK